MPNRQAFAPTEERRAPESATPVGSQEVAGRSLEGAPTAAEQLSRILSIINEVIYEAAVPDALSSARILYASPQIERILGYRPEEFAQDPTLWTRVMHPDDVATIRNADQRVLEQERPVVRQYRLRHKITGEYRWIEDSVAPQMDAQGRITALYGAARDVTERKQAADALRDGEARWRALFKGFPMPTYAWRKVGEEFVLADYNDAGDATTGGAVARWLGLTAAAMYPDMPEVVADLRRCLAERITIKREMLYRFRFSAQSRPLAITYAFVPPDTVMVHAEDITERTTAQEALHARVRQQAAVATLGQWALAGIGLDTLLEEAVALVAQTLDLEYCKVLELLPEGGALLLRAGVGWRTGCVGHATVSTGTGSQAGYTLVSEAPVVVEDLRAETRFAAPQLLLDHGVASGMAVPISGAVRPFGVLGAHSARKRSFSEDDVHFLQAVANILGAAVIRFQGEEARLRLIEMLMSAQEDERRHIAQELHDEAGQALTSLLVRLRVLQGAHSTREARAEASRLRNLVARTIDDIARLARGLRPAALDDLGLRPALRRFAAEESHVLGIAIKLNTRGLGAARLVPTMETALYRIAQEAVTNAVRHGGAKRVEIGIVRAEPHVVLKVRDDGRGFSPRDAEAGLRHPLGLGLQGIRERAAALGGKVTVESARDHGTTITVRVPLPEAGASPSEQRSSARSPARRG